MNIQLNEEQILDACIQLLEIPSVSQYEQDVASYIKHRCNALHIDFLEDDTTSATGSNVGNIICHVNGTCKEADPIFFTAHMDTIEANPVKPIIENGYIKTDGTTALGADDKVGIIALLEAIGYLKESNQLYGDIQFIFTVCEEQGLVGARSFNKDLITGKFGYTLDADEPVGTLITQSPANSHIIITVFTEKPDLKTNVHEAISKVIRSISKHIDHKGVDVSIIGFQNNKHIQEGAIDLTIELKSLSNVQLNAYIYELKECTLQSTQSTNCAHFFHVENICTNYSYTIDDQIVDVATKAGNKLDLPITYIKRLDISDANVFTSDKTPTMNIGVGYEQIHTKNEQIAISEIYDLTRFIIAIILQVAHK